MHLYICLCICIYAWQQWFRGHLGSMLSKERNIHQAFCRRTLQEYLVALYKYFERPYIYDQLQPLVLFFGMAKSFDTQNVILAVTAENKRKH